MKLPRVPVSDNIPGGDVPTFRKLWENIRSKMPEERSRKSQEISTHSAFPPTLITALDALYGH